MIVSVAYDLFTTHDGGIPLSRPTFPKDTTSELAGFALSFMLSTKQEAANINFLKSLVSICYAHSLNLVGVCAAQ